MSLLDIFKICLFSTCEKFYFNLVSYFVVDAVAMLLTSGGESADLCVVIIARVIALCYHIIYILSFLSVVQAP